MVGSVTVLLTAVFHLLAVRKALANGLPYSQKELSVLPGVFNSSRDVITYKS